MTGRAIGKDIVQEYRSAEGHLVQWCFTEIATESFHWIARQSTDQGATWKLTGEFFLRRNV
jgi:hypothetical protein